MASIQSHSDKLVRMAEQIAAFFESYPADQAETAIVRHLNDFWSRQMRRDLLAITEQSPMQLSKNLRNCLSILRQTIESSHSELSNSSAKTSL